MFSVRMMVGLLILVLKMMCRPKTLMLTWSEKGLGVTVTLMLIATRLEIGNAICRGKVSLRIELCEVFHRMYIAIIKKPFEGRSFIIFAEPSTNLAVIYFPASTGDYMRHVVLFLEIAKESKSSSQ